MHWTLIINPTSAGGQAQKLWPRIQSALDQEQLSYDYFFTEHKGHAIQLVKESTRLGQRQFVVVGGDGSLNEVVNGLCLQKKVPLKRMYSGLYPRWHRFRLDQISSHSYEYRTGRSTVEKTSPIRA
jgi:diacylglycerol kinase (ATP)